jgi:hypothetical protein
MAESLLKGFLSEAKVKKPSKGAKSIPAPAIEKKLPKYKANKFKGFYITHENLVRLKELQAHFLKEGKNLDESDILNQALELLYSQVLSKSK